MSARLFYGWQIRKGFNLKRGSMERRQPSRFPF